MELKYIVTTIIKIVISVPTIVVIYCTNVEGSALMGGHLNNTEVVGNSTVSNENYFNDYDYDVNEETINEWDTISTTEGTSHTQKHFQSEETEEIPNSSSLVSSGYNLPEKIFNNGKPYYLDIEPITGHTGYRHKESSVHSDNLHDDEVNSDMYQKANINRKDGSLINHKLSDVNQLSPTFHDLLHLPMKYNNDKYIYPLISSSYANTKVQGNINKYYNHKLYENIPVLKLTSSPAFHFTLPNQTKVSDTSSDSIKIVHTHSNTPVTAWTPAKTKTTSITTTTTTTTRQPPSLINSPISHPNLNEEYDYDFFYSTSNTQTDKIYVNANNIHDLTEKPPSVNTENPKTTTKRILSLYEQLFGDYEEETTTKVNNNQNDESTESNKKHHTYNNYSQSFQYLDVSTELTSGKTEINLETNNNYEYEDDYEVIPSKNFKIGTQNPEHKTLPTTTKRLITMQSITSTTPNLINKATTSIKKLEQTTTLKTTAKLQSLTTQNTPATVITTASPLVFKNASKPVSQIMNVPVLNVTSLPFGENHIVGLNHHQSLILTTQDLTETLNREMIETKPFKYDRPVLHTAPNTNNIHIPPYQDTVSFVVGNYQNTGKVDYGTSFNANAYNKNNNAFKPFYKHNQPLVTTTDYVVQVGPDVRISPETSEKAAVIEPTKTVETVLVMNDSFRQESGIEDKLETNSDQNESSKSNRSRIVFPDEKQYTTNYSPSLYHSQYGHSTNQASLASKINDLNLHSNQMYQLPSDLTPPKEEQALIPPPRIDRPRPPWDPRPGHFYAGKPEYTRPPRPPLDIALRRVDNLPNILPQFRPNMNIPQAPPLHSHLDGFNRQPLLDRPSNRPIAFFERLHPPPPSKKLPSHRQTLSQLHNQRPSQSEYHIVDKTIHKTFTEQYPSYETPPKFSIAKRRNSENEEIETLQMINVKKAERKHTTEESEVSEASTKRSATNENSLYVVYPVNSTPLKLDVINSHKKETVVVGTRAELPLPPSKINQQNDKNPLLNLSKDRTDFPVLRPHSKLPQFPIQSDFPYPLEIPNPPIHISSIAQTPENENKLGDQTIKYQPDTNHKPSVNWKTPEGIIKSHQVSTLSNQISPTLKTYTETPIAVAYRPTESQKNYFNDYIHSVPDHSRSTISNVRMDGTDNENHDINNEMLLKKTIHVQPHIDMLHGGAVTSKPSAYKNHRTDTGVANVPVQQEFQAPFQASVNIDSSNSQGWFVIRNKKLSTSQVPEVTTQPIATTSEFNIENFNPQLEGGFKPIYTYSNDQDKIKILNTNEDDN